MTNPFAAFEVSDDEDTFQKTTTEQPKVKRTHQEKKQFKIQQEVTKTQTHVVAEEIVPDRVKEDAKKTRHNHAPPTPQTKKLGQGHYLDRRSGTGRDDRPRKEGGGRGNIGNIKDDLNQDKYIKQTKEQTQPSAENIPTEAEVPVEVKPEEPEKLTLEQYYKAKGVEINPVYEKKTVTRKAELNAEWIKKEKLTVLQSKEDKKNSERNVQNTIKFNTSKAGLDQNLQSLGFGQKPTKKHEEKREQKPEYKGKGKKAIIHDEDFPSL